MIRLHTRRRVEVPRPNEIQERDLDDFTNFKETDWHHSLEENEKSGCLFAHDESDDSTNFNDSPTYFLETEYEKENVLPRELAQYQQLYKQKTQSWVQHNKNDMKTKPQTFLIEGQSKSLSHIQSHHTHRHEKFVGLSSHKHRNQETTNDLSTASIHAAGTPARTLRQKVAALQKEKKDLLARSKQQQDDNLELQQRIEALEGCLRDLPRLSVSAPSGSEKHCAISNNGTASDEQVNGELSSALGLIEHHTDDEEDRLSSAHYEQELKVMKLQVERMRSAIGELHFEKEALEQQLSESDMARKFVTWRYCFRCIDKDHDGLIGLEEITRFETFTPYSMFSLNRAYNMWNTRNEDNFKMDEDDVVKFVAWAEEKGLREALEFWFAVADVDGDGYIGRHDILELFQYLRDYVQMTEDDLLCQLYDMVQPLDSNRGFSLTDLKRCKLGTGVINLIFNHGDGMRSRTTAEWGKGDYPL